MKQLSDYLQIIRIPAVLLSLCILAACQTTGNPVAETSPEPVQEDVTAEEETATSTFKGKPFSKDLDPNDMENNPFAFNRM